MFARKLSVWNSLNLSSANPRLVSGKSSACDGRLRKLTHWCDIFRGVHKHQCGTGNDGYEDRAHQAAEGLLEEDGAGSDDTGRG